MSNETEWMTDVCVIHGVRFMVAPKFVGCWMCRQRRLFEDLQSQEPHRGEVPMPTGGRIAENLRPPNPK